MSNATKLPVRSIDKPTWDAIAAAKGWKLIEATARLGREFAEREGIAVKRAPRKPRRGRTA